MNATDRFLQAFSPLFCGNFFTSATDISRFLTALAEDEELRSVLSSSVDGFRSEEEYRKVFFEGQPLPDRPEKVVALVTAFLFRVDARGESLSDRLAALFPGEDSAKAYRSFGLVYLKPYAESFVALLDGATDEVEESKPVYDKMNEDVTAHLEQFLREAATLSLSPEESDELSDATREMKYVLPYNDAILTAFSYHRLEFLCKLYRVDLPSGRELKTVLKLYGVI